MRCSNDHTGNATSIYVDDVTWRHHIGPGGQAELLNIWGAVFYRSKNQDRVADV